MPVYKMSDVERNLWISGTIEYIQQYTAGENTLTLEVT